MINESVTAAEKSIALGDLNRGIGVLKRLEKAKEALELSIAVEGNLGELGRQRDDLLNKVQGLQVSVKSIETKLSDLKDSEETMESTMKKTANIALANLNDKVSTEEIWVKAKIDEFSSSFEKVRVKYDEDIKKMEGEKVRVSEELSTLQASLESLKRTVSKLI